MLKVIFIIWVTIKRHIMMIALATTITICVVISYPCFIKSIPFFGWQGVSKISNGGIKNYEFRFEKRRNTINRVDHLFRPFDRIGIKAREFSIDFASKSGSSIFKIILPRDVFAQEVSSKSTNEYPCDCIQEGKESIHYDPTSFDSFKGWLLGICFGLLVIFYFTQRRNQPEQGASLAIGCIDRLNVFVPF
jgi:hypothetical protein